MVDAFAAQPGKGVITLDRRMLEALDADIAARILARAGPSAGQQRHAACHGRPPSPDRANLQTAMSLSVLAARAAGIAVLDGVHNDLDAAEDFNHACAMARDFGFDGKSVIHPSQIATPLFSPTPKRSFTPDACWTPLPPRPAGGLRSTGGCWRRWTPTSPPAPWRARAFDMRLYDEALAKGELKPDAAQSNAARRLSDLAEALKRKARLLAVPQDQRRRPRDFISGAMSGAAKPC